MQILTQTLNDLVKKKKTNKPLMSEIKMIYNSYLMEISDKNFSDFEKNQPKQDFVLNEKLSKMDKKFEFISNENKILKEFVRTKTQDFKEIKVVLTKFQKELNNLKQNRQINMKILDNKKLKSPKKNYPNISQYYHYNNTNKNAPIINKILINKKLVIAKSNINVIRDNIKKKFISPEKKEIFPNLSKSQILKKNQKL